MIRIKIIIKAKNRESSKAIIKWCENPNNKNDCVIESTNPVVMSETFKESAIRFMLKGVAKRLRIKPVEIKNIPEYNDLLCKKLKEKIADNLKIDKRSINIEVE